MAANEEPFADEVVERRAHRQPGDAEVAAQLTLGRDRLADAELLDEVEHPAPGLGLLGHGLPRTLRLGLRLLGRVRVIVRPGGGWSRPPGRGCGNGVDGRRLERDDGVAHERLAGLDVEEVESRRVDRELGIGALSHAAYADRGAR